MENIEQNLDNSPQRLCSEIKLFDLCDLDKCRYKSGRYCSNDELVSRFEKIAEDEISPPQRYIDEELDDGDGEFEDEFHEYGFEDEGEEDFDR
jgi:hypothetical protein